MTKKAIDKAFKDSEEAKMTLGASIARAIRFHEKQIKKLSNKRK